MSSRWWFLPSLLYGLLLGLGLPLWDDDYTSWLLPAMGKSYGEILWEILSPASTQSQTWGFNERPWELLYYKVAYSLSGYESWSYWIFKSAALGAMLWGFHRWARDLVPQTRWGAWAAGASSAFLLFAPCTAAAFVWHADFEPVASAWFLLCSREVWRKIEQDDRSVRGWLAIIFLTYLGYKAKAGLKLIPAIAISYAVLRGRFKLLGPLALMGLLALPWSRQVFQTPPFLSQRDSGLPEWMWQFPSFSRLEAFFWNAEVGDMGAWLSEPTLSLLGTLGPLTLIPLAFVAFPERARPRNEFAALFLFLWAAIAVAAVTVLPALTYFFRIRYGLILLVPIGLLLAWTLGRMEKMGQPLLAVVMTALFLQCAVNLNRSLVYRARLGAVISVVDLAYQTTTELEPNGSLLLKGVLSYEWHPDAPAIVSRRSPIGSWDDALSRPGAYVLSWEKPPGLMSPVRTVSSSQVRTLFDVLYPWPVQQDLYLSRVP